MTTALTTPETSRAAHGGWRGWNLAALTAMSGYVTALGWQAQLVSYPLFRAVGREEFLDYHAQYNDGIVWVVIVPGFATFLSQVAFWWTRPAGTSRTAAALVAAGGVTAIASTVLWAIPRHDRLDRIGQDAATIDSLLGANLLRTIALTAASAGLCWILGRSSAHPTR